MKSKEMKNIPTLRFPEFMNDGEWEDKVLIDISDFINKKISLDKLTINNYISTENLLQDFSGVAISSKLPDVKSVTHFRENDILISNIRPYLKKIWSATFEGGASNDVIVVRAKENTNNNFLTYLLKNEKFINYVMQGAKGVKMPRGDISLIKKYPLFISSIPREQQKIADCLSSIDNLITAQSKKVETLKEHKKGLMQQLFPTDGKKVPKRRFPEFLNDGEWEEKNGNIVFEQISNKEHNSDLPILAITQENGAIPRELIDYNVSVTSKSIESYKVVEINDFIISLRSFQGGIEYSQYKGICSPAYIILRKKIDIEEIFFKYYFKTHKFIQDLNKNLEGIRDGKMVSYKQFSELLLPLPSKNEQQKIADCLSSIDNLITAQSKKVETLKEHKKGLMQQLFPSKELQQ
jgi:type I restriction enzyme, S subunit